MRQFFLFLNAEYKYSSYRSPTKETNPNTMTEKKHFIL
jgi:hypothetical protein